MNLLQRQMLTVQEAGNPFVWGDHLVIVFVSIAIKYLFRVLLEVFCRD